MRTLVVLASAQFGSQGKESTRGGLISRNSPSTTKVLPRTLRPSLSHFPPTRRSRVHAVHQYCVVSPHQATNCSGSVKARKTRSGGALIKISSMMASLSGLMVGMPALLLRLDVGFQPPQTPTQRRPVLVEPEVHSAKGQGVQAVARVSALALLDDKPGP